MQDFENDFAKGVEKNKKICYYIGKINLSLRKNAISDLQKFKMTFSRGAKRKKYEKL